MSVSAYGTVGSAVGTSKAADGTELPLRVGSQGDQIVSQLHGERHEAATRGTIFHVASQAAATTSAAFATTYTGLCISNPIGSGIKISLLKIGYSFIVAQGTGGNSVGLMVGYNAATAVTHTTPSTSIQSSIVGANSPTAVAKVDTAATLPTAPYAVKIFGSVGTGAITVAMTNAMTEVDLKGEVILMPGAYAALFTLIASGSSSLLASFTWEEVAL